MTWQCDPDRYVPEKEKPRIFLPMHEASLGRCVLWLCVPWTMRPRVMCSDPWTHTGAVDNHNSFMGSHGLSRVPCKTHAGCYLPFSSQHPVHCRRVEQFSQRRLQHLTFSKYYIHINMEDSFFSSSVGMSPCISLKIKNRHYEHHMIETHR